MQLGGLFAGYNQMDSEIDAYFTGIRRNMRNCLMPLLDKLLLRRRFIIETLFDRLKSQMGLEHTRHRSPINAFVHILSCLAAYTPGKTRVSMRGVQ